MGYFHNYMLYFREPDATAGDGTAVDGTAGVGTAVNTTAANLIGGGRYSGRVTAIYLC